MVTVTITDYDSHVRLPGQTGFRYHFIAHADQDATLNWRIKDHNDQVVLDRTGVSFFTDDLGYYGDIDAQYVPSDLGEYTWTLEVYDDQGTVLASRTFTVEVAEAATGKAAIEILSVDPDTIRDSPGTQHTITVTLVNSGDNGSIVSVSIKDHNNQTVDAKVILLNIDEQEQVSFTITLPDQEGTYIWKVETYNQDTENTDDTHDVTLEAVTADFVITSYPGTVSGRPAEDKQFDVTVANQGTQQGTLGLEILDHNGNQVFYTEKTVDAGTETTETVSIVLPDNPGTYTWSIRAWDVEENRVDDAKTFTVVVESGTATKEYGWIALLAILLFILLLLRRK